MNHRIIIFTSLLAALPLAVPAFAGEEHQHDMPGMQHEHSGMMPQGGGMAMDGGNVFLVKREVDGYQVSFHVMPAKEGMQHAGTHTLMIKVEKDGTPLPHLIINSKVTHPNGESESKMMMQRGPWYIAGYNLGHDGKHQLMTLFKTKDGAKHFAGVYYPDDSAK